jgi:DNA-binding MarR family transcriptional regulator
VDPDTGLTPERLQLLARLVHQGPATPADLAAELGVSPPAVARMVTGLEEIGLVRRGPSGPDGRRVAVRALAAGERWMERGRTNRIRALAGRLRGLSKNELLTLRRATRILGRLLED